MERGVVDLPALDLAILVISVYDSPCKLLQNMVILFLRVLCIMEVR